MLICFGPSPLLTLCWSPLYSLLTTAGSNQSIGRHSWNLYRPIICLVATPIFYIKFPFLFLFCEISGHCWSTKRMKFFAEKVFIVRKRKEWFWWSATIKRTTIWTICIFWHHKLSHMTQYCLMTSNDMSFDVRLCPFWRHMLRLTMLYVLKYYDVTCHV